MKYTLMTGGMISGIGKSVIGCIIGSILKSCGVLVTFIKIDPKISIDAGTFSPYEHGEVFVLDDGGVVDLDLGKYERLLDVTLHRDNNITTGKVYQHVINNERRGDYLGKTVHVVPHITDAIQGWVERVARIPVDGDNKTPDVCIVELGGTLGDIETMPFVEAFRQFQFRVKQENFCSVHVSVVPQTKATGEQKSKPTQASVRQLRAFGISLDLIVCRSTLPISQSIKDKISMLCHVQPQQVFSIHDVSSIYRVPLLLEEQGITEYIVKRLQMELQSPQPRTLMVQWTDLADRYEHLLKDVTIAMVGKYTQLEDSYASVVKALKHSALAVDRRLNVRCIEDTHLELETFNDDPSKYHDAWRQLTSANGIIVPGSFGVRGMEGKILAVNWARTKKIPFLGVCLGLQCAVVEFSRNVLGWTRAHSTEMDPTSMYPVVIEMPEQNPGQMGETTRVGKRKTIFKMEDSIMKKLYNDVEFVEERHRHRYEVNPVFVPELEKNGLKFVGHSEDGKRMEIMELKDHPYFIGVQFHSEYISRPLKPSPPYLGLLLAACGRLQHFVHHGLQMLPHISEDDENSQDDDISKKFENLKTVSSLESST